MLMSWLIAMYEQFYSFPWLDVLFVCFFSLVTNWNLRGYAFCAAIWWRNRHTLDAASRRAKKLPLFLADNLERRGPTDVHFEQTPWVWSLAGVLFTQNSQRDRNEKANLSVSSSSRLLYILFMSEHKRNTNAVS